MVDGVWKFTKLDYLYLVGKLIAIRLFYTYYSVYKPDISYDAWWRDGLLYPKKTSEEPPNVTGFRLSAGWALNSNAACHLRWLYKRE